MVRDKLKNNSSGSETDNEKVLRRAKEAAMSGKPVEDATLEPAQPNIEKEARATGDPNKSPSSSESSSGQSDERSQLEQMATSSGQRVDAPKESDSTQSSTGKDQQSTSPSADGQVVGAPGSEQSQPNESKPDDTRPESTKTQHPRDAKDERSPPNGGPPVSGTPAEPGANVGGGGAAGGPETMQRWQIDSKEDAKTYVSQQVTQKYPWADPGEDFRVVEQDGQLVTEFTDAGRREAAIKKANQQIQEQYPSLDRGEDYTIAVSDGKAQVDFTEQGQKELVLSQYDTPSGQVEAEQVADGAFKVTVSPGDETAPAQTGTGPRTELVAVDDQGQAFLEDLQMFSDQEQAVRQDAKEEAVLEVQQDARRRMDTAKSQFKRGAFGDTQEIIAEDAAQELTERYNVDVGENDITVRRAGPNSDASEAGRGPILSPSMQRLAGDSYAVGISADAVNQTGIFSELAQSGATTGVRRGGPDATPRQKVEAQLESKTGVELSQEDIQFERKTLQDGTTVLQGRLNESGEETVAVENAPGQGTPIEPLTEYGAKLNEEYKQSTEPVQNTWNRYTPDVGGVEATFNKYTPDSSDLTGLAASFAPIAAAEPTPAGEVGTGVLLGGAAVLGAGGFLSSTNSNTNAATAATSEVEIPENGRVYQQEIPLEGRPGGFVNEMGVPDPTERDVNQFGVPEQGIVYDVDENTKLFIDDEVKAGDPVSTTRIPLPESDETLVAVQAQELIQQSRQKARRDRSSNIRERATRREVPEEFIPNEEVTIGGDSTNTGGGGFPTVPSRPSPALIIGNNGSVGFIGRRPKPGTTLNDPYEQFLGVNQSFESEAIRQSAQQAKAQGQPGALTLFPAGVSAAAGRQGSRPGIGSLIGTSLGTQLDATTRARSRARVAGQSALAFNSTFASTQATSTAEATSQANVDEYADLYEYQYQMQFASETGRKRGMPDEPESGGSDSTGSRFDVGFRLDGAPAPGWLSETITGFGLGGIGLRNLSESELEEAAAKGSGGGVGELPTYYQVKGTSTQKAQIAAARQLFSGGGLGFDVGADSSTDQDNENSDVLSFNVDLGGGGWL